MRQFSWQAALVIGRYLPWIRSRRSARSQQRVPKLRAIEELEARQLMVASPVIGAGTGLAADYFTDQGFTNLGLTRVDPTVSFDWTTGAPASSLPNDHFSVRWSGQVQAQYSEQYTFYTQSDEGIRLYVNNQVVIDDWTSHATTEDSGTLTLVAGQAYDIKLEYYDATGAASARLLWSSASTTKAVIPTSQLYPNSQYLSDNWLNQDIGSPTLAGSVVSRGTTYSITGAGTGIGGSSDQFQFVYKSLTGDGQIIAQLNGELSTGDPLAKAGVMIRDGLDVGAPLVDLVMNPGISMSMEARTTRGGALATVTGTIAATPAWMKLVRDGNSFSTYTSDTGVDGSWTLLSTVGLSMSNTIQIGMAVTSHVAGTANVAALANVAVTRTLPLGAGLGGEFPYSTDFVFVDAMKTAGPFYTLSSNGFLNTNVFATTDSAGNALSDFGVYVNQVAPEPGVYHLSAVSSVRPTVSAPLGGATFSNTAYNTTTHVFTADVTVASQGTPGGVGQLVLAFRNTGGTLKQLQLFRPGYDPTNPPTFTDEYLNLIRANNPTVLRFMDWEVTNANVVSDWSERTLPTDATQEGMLTKTVVTTSGSQVVTSYKGIAWEYTVQLANLLHKDMWINIPLLATDDYIQQLATLIKSTLSPDLNVYLEYSNEVWNDGFIQASENRQLALNAVAAGSSNLNYDGASDGVTLGDRRVAQRLKQASDIFGAVFGAGSINTQVRPVLAYQNVGSFRFDNQLTYIVKNYGAPSNYFYALSVAPYFGMNGEDTNTNLSVDDVLAALSASIDYFQKSDVLDQTITEARYYGLKTTAYEGGPDTFGNNNVAAKKAAMLDPRMQDLMTRFLNIWYSKGGDLFNWFVIAAGNFDTNFGTWAITNDLHNYTQPKELAYVAVQNSPQATITTGVTLPAQIDARYYSAAPTPVSSPYLHNFQTDNHFDYLVIAPTAGTYNLKVSVGASVSGGLLDVLVNNVMVGTLSVPNNGLGDGGDTFVDTASLPLQLGAGQNVIRLHIPAAHSYNIDSLKITNAANGSLGDTLPMLGRFFFPYQNSVTAGSIFSQQFTVNDSETNWTQLTVTATSDNPSILPNNSANISLAQTPINGLRLWTITINTIANLLGTSNIYVTVSDGQRTRTVRMFQLGIGGPGPSGLVATSAGASQVNLSWVDNTNNESGYKVDVSTSNTFASATTITLPTDTTSYGVPGLTAGVPYYFRVRATYGTSDSPNTSIVTATPTLVAAPNAPSGLTATAATTSQINLIWADNSFGESGFEVDVSTSAAFTRWVTYNVPPNTTSLSVTGLTAASVYYFRVRALGLYDSAYATAATQSTQVNAQNLTQAQGPFATAGSAQVLVAWTPPAGAASYNLYVGTQPGAETLFTTGFWTNGSVTVANLLNGTKYYFQIAAVVDYIEGPRSTEVSATPVASQSGSAGGSVSLPSVLTGFVGPFTAEQVRQLAARNQLVGPLPLAGQVAQAAAATTALTTNAVTATTAFASAAASSANLLPTAADLALQTAAVLPVVGGKKSTVTSAVDQALSDLEEPESPLDDPLLDLLAGS